jgi:hypothetical protein
VLTSIAKFRAYVRCVDEGVIVPYDTALALGGRSIKSVSVPSTSESESDLDSEVGICTITSSNRSPTLGPGSQGRGGARINLKIKGSSVLVKPHGHELCA